MINPTVETDLVGEIAEVWESNPGTIDRRMIIRGRVRAVTAYGSGQMMLWIEMVDGSGWWGANDYKPGDVIRVPTDTGCGDNLIRLIKE